VYVKPRGIVALGTAAKVDLEVVVTTLGEIQRALACWAEKLSIEPEHAHQSPVGVQAEAMRLALSALAVRAASERLALASQPAMGGKDGAS
jgi:hypothetical protein